MSSGMINPTKRIRLRAYKAPYDTSNFVNTGEFFEKYPDVTPHVTRFERQDASGKIEESWERNEQGIMVNMTARDKLYEEIEAAQEALEDLREKENNNG